MLVKGKSCGSCVFKLCVCVQHIYASKVRSKCKKVFAKDTEIPSRAVARHKRLPEETPPAYTWAAELHMTLQPPDLVVGWHCGPICSSSMRRLIMGPSPQDIDALKNAFVILCMA